MVSQGGELLPNETVEDETGPGSVRGEANGEGQPVARMPAVDHKQCSSPQQAPVGDDALHTMVQYHTAGEEALVVVSRSHMEKP